MIRGDCRQCGEESIEGNRSTQQCVPGTNSVTPPWLWLVGAGVLLAVWYTDPEVKWTTVVGFVPGTRELLWLTFGL